MKQVYCLYGDNHTVADFYLDVIAKGFEALGYNIDIVTIANSKNLNKKNPVIVPSAVDLLLLYRKGFRNFVMWNQGTIPEESYMRRHSRIKWVFLSLVEWWGLKKAKVNLFVSEAQKIHFEKTYHMDFTNNSYIMPCYNCMLEESTFQCPEKYSKNIFAYTGSFFAPWQYIHGNLSFYKKLEDKYGDKVFLKVLTPHQDLAKEQMAKYGIKNYSIGCVRPEKIPDAIADAKFGLLLREDNIVNNIATPTKLSSYMSCGLIPVVSECIRDYAKHMEGRDFFVLIDNDLNTENVERLIEDKIETEQVLNEFSKYWDEQYNTERHIKNISMLLKKFFLLK